MNSRSACALTPQMPLVHANRIVDLSSDQLQNVSLSILGKALEPAGNTDRERVTSVNDENLELRLQLQRLQGQLTQQHLYQVRHTSLLVRMHLKPPPPPNPFPRACLSRLHLYTCATHIGDLHSSSKTMHVYMY